MRLPSFWNCREFVVAIFMAVALFSLPFTNAGAAISSDGMSHNVHSQPMHGETEGNDAASICVDGEGGNGCAAMCSFVKCDAAYIPLNGKNALSLHCLSRRGLASDAITGVVTGPAEQPPRC